MTSLLITILYPAEVFFHSLEQKPKDPGISRFHLRSTPQSALVQKHQSCSLHKPCAAGKLEQRQLLTACKSNIVKCSLIVMGSAGGHPEYIKSSVPMPGSFGWLTCPMMV